MLGCVTYMAEQRQAFGCGLAGLGAGDLEQMLSCCCDVGLGRLRRLACAVATVTAACCTRECFPWLAAHNSFETRVDWPWGFGL